eukprot:12104735-Ditylum_brightwellii.AAC.1
MMIMSKLHKLHTRSIDFVLAYPQAGVKIVIYLHPPAGIIIDTNGENVVLRLKKSLWAQRSWQDMEGTPV